MGVLGLVFHVGGNLSFFSLAVTAEFVGVRFHRHQIYDAAQVLLTADGQFQWNHGATEGVGEAFEYALGVGAIAVHATGHDHARRVVLLAIIPDALSYDFDASDAVHNYNCGVYHRQHHLGFVDEHVETRGVHDVDLRFAPFHVGQSGRQRHLAGDFLVVVVRGSAAVVHAAQALVSARGVEHG